MKVSLLLVLLVTMAGVSHAADDRTLGRQADAIFSSTKTRNAPGAAVLVLRNGKPVFERGYGVTDLRTRRALTARTNFRLASVTKQFTAMAVMLLVHDGKLRYDDALTSVFPDFPAYGKAITIRNLLNHTSGLLDYEDLMGSEYSETRQIQDSEVLALLERQDHTRFAPGTRWEYSNSGYVVLGLVVQKISGQTFGDFLRERIFKTLHMDRTLAYQRGRNEVQERAYGHTLENGRWKETDQSSTSATLGDGGVYSSLEDMAKWDAGLRAHTLLSEAEMLPALTPAKFPEPVALSPEGKPVQYGFGWFLEPHGGNARMWHYGETMGFRSAIERFPATGLTVIVLSNRADTPAPDLALKIADLYLQ